MTERIRSRWVDASRSGGEISSMRTDQVHSLSSQKHPWFKDIDWQSQSNSRIRFEGTTRLKVRLTQLRFLAIQTSIAWKLPISPR
jgi:hypothetical protein